MALGPDAHRAGLTDVTHLPGADSSLSLLGGGRVPPGAATPRPRNQTRRHPFQRGQPGVQTLAPRGCGVAHRRVRARATGSGLGVHLEPGRSLRICTLDEGAVQTPKGQARLLPAPGYSVASFRGGPWPRVFSSSSSRRNTGFQGLMTCPVPLKHLPEALSPVQPPLENWGLRLWLFLPTHPHGKAHPLWALQPASGERPAGCGLSWSQASQAQPAKKVPQAAWLAVAPLGLDLAPSDRPFGCAAWDHGSSLMLYLFLTRPLQASGQTPSRVFPRTKLPLPAKAGLQGEQVKGDSSRLLPLKAVQGMNVPLDRETWRRGRWMGTSGERAGQTYLR